MRDAAALDILFVVYILFVISILCGIALVGATVAIVHHVRASQLKNRRPPPPAPHFEEHLMAATEYGTPRSARRISHQNVQSITAKKDYVSTSQEDVLHTVRRSSERDASSISRRSGDTHTNSFRVISGLRSASAQRF